MKTLYITLFIILVTALVSAQSSVGQGGGMSGPIANTTQFQSNPRTATYTAMGGERSLLSSGSTTMGTGEQEVWQFGHETFDPYCKCPSVPLGDVARYWRIHMAEYAAAWELKHRYGGNK